MKKWRQIFVYGVSVLLFLAVLSWHFHLWLIAWSVECYARTFLELELGLSLQEVSAHRLLIAKLDLPRFGISLDGLEISGSPLFSQSPNLVISAQAITVELPAGTGGSVGKISLPESVFRFFPSSRISLQESSFSYRGFSSTIIGTVSGQVDSTSENEKSFNLLVAAAIPSAQPIIAAGWNLTAEKIQLSLQEKADHPLSFILQGKQIGLRNESIVLSNIQATWQGLVPSDRIAGQVVASLPSYTGPVEVKDIVGKGNFTFSLPQSLARINSLQAKVLGGKITLGAVSLSIPGKPCLESSVSLSKLALPELLALYKNDSLSAEGSISGVLPFRYCGGKLTVAAGSVQSDAPGFLRFESPVDLPSESVSTAAQALKHFAFKELKAGLVLEEDGKLTITSHLSGKSLSLPKEPALNLNLSLEENLYKLLETLTRSKAVLNSEALSNVQPS